MLDFVFPPPVVAPPELPAIDPRLGPLDWPAFGWFPEPDDRIAFIAHDPPDRPYRAEGLPGVENFTNETDPKIFDYDGTNPPAYKNYMTVNLTNLHAWQRDIETKNSYRVLEKFVRKGYGWCDGSTDSTSPYGGNIAYHVTDTGGNRRRCVKIVKDNQGHDCAIIEMVPAVGIPPAYTYLKDPQFIQKQSCVTANITWRTPKEGDVNWLNMAPDQFAAYLIYDPVDKLTRVQFYPQTPFDAILHERNVTVLQYCLQGSTTLVYVTGELLGWYIADESPPSPLSYQPYASLSWRDYRKYIKFPQWVKEPKWPEPTIQNCGWVQK